jgi:hypothetical protein
MRGYDWSEDEAMNGILGLKWFQNPAETKASVSDK